jgi:flavorubredoxin
MAMSRSEALEILPGRLYRIGGIVRLDGTVTWGPADGTYQPVSGYLILNADGALLVDTGVKAHEQLIRDQLRSVLSPGSRLSIFLTRAEYDCFGALTAVSADYKVEQIYTGGTQNPFDAFEEVTGFAEKWDQRLQLGRQAVGHSQVLDHGRLEVLTPALRVLATFWGYHPTTKTLFTSDVFGHTSMPQETSRGLIGEDSVDTATVDSVRDHLLTRFFWLADANTSTMQQNLRAIFEQHDIEVIAPTHGCALVGKKVVRRHYDLLQEVLATIHDKRPEKVATVMQR